jgi:transcriptional regulator
MYVPTSFAETDQDKLHGFIDSHSFATVVSHESGEPVASHLPLLLDRENGALGDLVGHMAKANSQWKGTEGHQVLAVFHGPHAYISPTWLEAANVVPTWNYVAVHVYGTFRIDDNPTRRLEIVRRYVEFYEAQLEPPWSLDNADDDFIGKLLDAIVGFRIDIERIEGKWKLNQNHDPQRRTKIIRALREAGSEDRDQIAELMSQTMEDK